MDTTEQERRARFAAAFAPLGHGGIAKVAKAAGVNRRYIDRRLLPETHPDASKVAMWDVYAAEAIAAEILNEPKPRKKS